MPERARSHVRCGAPAAAAIAGSNARSAASDTQSRCSRPVSSSHELPAAATAARYGVTRRRPRAVRAAALALALGAVEGRSSLRSTCGFSRPERRRSVRFTVGTVMPIAFNTRARFTALLRSAQRDPERERADWNGVCPLHVVEPAVEGRLAASAAALARRLRRRHAGSASTTGPKPPRGRSHAGCARAPLSARSSAASTRARFCSAAIRSHEEPASRRAVRSGATVGDLELRGRGRRRWCGITLVSIPERRSTGDTAFLEPVSSSARRFESSTAACCSTAVRRSQEVPAARRADAAAAAVERGESSLCNFGTRSLAAVGAPRVRGRRTGGSGETLGERILWHRRGILDVRTDAAADKKTIEIRLERSQDLLTSR